MDQITTALGLQEEWASELTVVWIQVLAPTLTGYVTPGSCLSFSETQLLHHKMG